MRSEQTTSSRSHSLAGLDHRELRSTMTGEVYSLSALLTEVLGFKDLFVHHEIIPPGRRSSAPHAHSEREEMALVLKGQVMAIAGDRVTELREGGFVGFRPGEQHVIQNNGDEPAHVLVIASNPERDRVLSGHSRSHAKPVESLPPSWTEETICPSSPSRTR